MTRLLLAVALLTATAAHAIEFKPKLEAEGRWFFDAEPDSVLASAAGTLEVFHGFGEGKQRIVGEFFARWDENDDSRTHEDVRELYYQWVGESLEFRLGARRVFWGVAESRHLVDIVNQSDFVENLDGEDKLGQPMVNLAWIAPFGTVDFFVLPYQRARTFQGPEGYPRLPRPVLAGEARYESADEQEHVDYAVRWSGTAGPVDFGLAWFDGTAREPRLEPCVPAGYSGTYAANPGPRAECDIPSTFVAPPPLPPPPPPAVIQQLFIAEVSSVAVLVPHYDLLRQASLDAQFVAGNLALKVEALRRDQRDRWTWATVSGFEYTFGDVSGSGADIGVLAEYLYDEKDDGLGVLADDDVFVGTRLSVNDVAGTTLLGGVVGTRKEFESRLYLLEASRRLTDDWRLAGELRVFEDMPPGSLEAFLEDQDFVTVTLERFF